MNKSYKHIPKDKRKKILLVTDDIRVHSGVATVAREIVIETCHQYNWVQIAGALKHPDERKKLDISRLSKMGCLGPNSIRIASEKCRIASTIWVTFVLK